jgi:hypothetical protein
LPCETIGQQAIATLHHCRDLLVKNRHAHQCPAFDADWLMVDAGSRQANGSHAARPFKARVQAACSVQVYAFAGRL